MINKGDLLSSYLFVIVMEAFNCLLKKVVCRLFSRLCMRGEEGDRVYLLFVDDTLVFYEAS